MKFRSKAGHPNDTYILLEKLKSTHGKFKTTIRSLKILLLADMFESQYTICHEIIGKKPGFCICVTGGIHGDEDTGAEAALAASEYAAKELVEGSLISIPWANPGAIRRRTRDSIYEAYDGESDLNRAFTKESDGSRLQQHANAILSCINNYNRKKRTVIMLI